MPPDGATPLEARMKPDRASMGASAYFCATGGAAAAAQSETQNLLNVISVDGVPRLSAGLPCGGYLNWSMLASTS